MGYLIKGVDFRFCNPSISFSRKQSDQFFLHYLRLSEDQVNDQISPTSEA